MRLLLPLTQGPGVLSSVIVFHLDVANIWGKIDQPKSRDIKMMLPLRTEWVEVMKIVCSIVRYLRVEQTYELIY